MRSVDHRRTGRQTNKHRREKVVVNTSVHRSFVSVPVKPATNTWYVSVPVWGKRYRDIFFAFTLPALEYAFKESGEDFTLVLHTDLPYDPIVKHCKLVRLKIPDGDHSFGSLSKAHTEVIAMAGLGDPISLLTADMVVSLETFVTCRRLFALGRKLICCAGMRVLDDELPELPLSGRELLAWGWDHRHSMTKECTWPDGTSYDVWRMYFEKDDEVACRLHLPHPIAFIRDNRRIGFGPTVDANLFTNFRLPEIFLITNPDELAVIELSPEGKEFVITETMRYRFNNLGPSCPSFQKIIHNHHRWMYGHKIIIKGDGGDCGDKELVRRFMG